jgi:NitT/TauT family transport system substrate-binding protein
LTWAVHRRQLNRSGGTPALRRLCARRRIPAEVPKNRQIADGSNLLRQGAVMIRIGSGFFAALAMVAGWLPSAGAAPLKIRLGWIVPVANMAPTLFAEPGVARHLGSSYTLQPVHFQGTPQMITALAVGDLDIGVLGFSSLNLAVQNAGMNDLRIISDEFEDGVDDYATNQFRVANDGPIKNLADLKGKVVAINATGSAVDIAMRAMLHRSGLEEKRDYTVVEAPFGAMKAMLAQNKVAMISAVPPFSEDPQLMQNSRTLFTEKDAMEGPSALGFWVAKSSFVSQNHAALVDFLEDAIRATRWYLDPKNHDAVVAIASKFTKAPPSLFQSWVFTQKDYYRNPDLLPDLKELQANIDLQRDLGFFKNRIDAAKYTNLALVKEAAGRLK